MSAEEAATQEVTAPIVAEGAPPAKSETPTPKQEAKPADKPADAKPAEAKPGEEKPAEAAKPVRPEGLADEFWNDETGVNYEALLGRMSELQTFKAEADVQRQGVPELPEGYELRIPESIEVPEGMDLTINPDDPLAKHITKVAHELGIPQEGLDKLVGAYAQSQIENANDIKSKVGDEFKKLGENGKQRVDAVMTALAGRVGKDAAQHLAGFMYTADSVKAFEQLLRGTAGPTPNVPGSTATSQSGKPWDQMTPDEKLAAAHARAKSNGQIGPHAGGNRG